MHEVQQPYYCLIHDLRYQVHLSGGPGLCCVVAFGFLNFGTGHGDQSLDLWESSEKNLKPRFSKLDVE